MATKQEKIAQLNDAIAIYNTKVDDLTNQKARNEATANQASLDSNFYLQLNPEIDIRISSVTAQIAILQEIKDNLNEEEV